MNCEVFEAKLRRMRCAVNSCLSLRTLFRYHDDNDDSWWSDRVWVKPLKKDAFMAKFGKGEDKQHWSTNPGIVKLALICCKNFRIARECSALLQPFDVLKIKRPNCFGRIFILPVNSWQSKFCSFSGYPGHVCTVYYSDLFSIQYTNLSHVFVRP